MTTLATEATTSAETEEKVASRMPEPKGYKLLIALPEISEKAFDAEGSIVIKPQASMDVEEVATTVGFVLAMGKDAYKNKERFPSGPRLVAGVMVRFARLPLG